MQRTGIDVIAKLLGRTTLAMTQRYAHIEIRLLRDAVEGLHPYDGTILAITGAEATSSGPGTPGASK
jgi:hypothetical protein